MGTENTQSYTQKLRNDEMRKRKTIMGKIVTLEKKTQSLMGGLGVKLWFAAEPQRKKKEIHRPFFMKQIRRLQILMYKILSNPEYRNYDRINSICLKIEFECICTKVALKPHSINAPTAVKFGSMLALSN